jgi:hypothetical protein
MDQLITAVPYRQRQEYELLKAFYNAWLRFHKIHNEGGEREILQGIAQDMQDAHIAVRDFRLHHPEPARV